MFLLVRHEKKISFVIVCSLLHPPSYRLLYICPELCISFVTICFASSVFPQHPNRLQRRKHKVCTPSFVPEWRARFAWPVPSRSVAHCTRAVWIGVVQMRALLAPSSGQSRHRKPLHTLGPMCHTIQAVATQNQPLQ